MHFFFNFVQKIANAERDRMIKTFKKIQFFCATSDVWSRSNRSFIAVSVHYFELKSLHLKTKFIACQHFPGRHTHDKVAQKLNSIFERYGISDKVYFVTTDNAGEYVAAFKRFGDNYQSINLLDEDDDDLRWLVDPPVASTSASVAGTSAVSADDVSKSNQTDIEHDDLESESESELDFDDPDWFMHTEQESDSMENQCETDLNDSSETDSDSFFVHELSSSLPLLMSANRVDCAAHKLDKLAKIDALKARNNSKYANIYDRVFTKLENIWSLKESRLNAEIFKKITGKKCTGPHRIRWLKTFEAVSCIVFICALFFLNMIIYLKPMQFHFLFSDQQYFGNRKIETK